MSISIKGLRDVADRAGLFLDFDGTLSRIVEHPDEARPFEGVGAVLTDLGRRYRTVSIVSGRSAEQLLDWLGTGIDIWGVHGAQRVRDGRVELSPIAAPFEDLMQNVLDEAHRSVAERRLEGVVIENKRVMVGLHFRSAADPAGAEAALDEIAEELTRRHGLLRAGGRMAFELRPPVEFSKAAVVLAVAEEGALEAAMFAGDDVVDLPGFEALDLLEGKGIQTLRVAVDSDEAPRELLERADITVRGPRGMMELLTELA